MTTLIYTWDKLHIALGTMALGEKPIREWLVDAVTPLDVNRDYRNLQAAIVKKFTPRLKMFGTPPPPAGRSACR
jgi:hypothetical protein